MKYDKRLNNIWKSCSTELTRYKLGSVKLDADKKVLVSTDGHMLVVTDVSDLLDAGEKSFLIPSSALKFSQSVSKKNAPPVRIEKREKAVAVVVGGLDQRLYCPGDASQFPRWEAVAPDPEVYKNCILVDPALLSRLYEAIYGEDFRGGVVLWFKDATSPMIVGRTGISKRYSLLMPMLGEKNMPAKFWDKKEPKAKKAVA